MRRTIYLPGRAVYPCYPDFGEKKRNLWELLISLLHLSAIKGLWTASVLKEISNKKVSWWHKMVSFKFLIVTRICFSHQNSRLLYTTLDYEIKSHTWDYHLRWKSQQYHSVEGIQWSSLQTMKAEITWAEGSPRNRSITPPLHLIWSNIKDTPDSLMDVWYQTMGDS